MITFANHTHGPFVWSVFKYLVLGFSSADLQIQGCRFQDLQCKVEGLRFGAKG